MRSSVLLLLILGLLAGLAYGHGDNNGQGSDRGRSDDYLSKEEIAEWHDKLYESTNALGAPGGGSSGLRGWAMMTLAMFEASNTIDKDYSFYTVSPSSVPSSINVRQASRRVAVAKAAQVVLDGLFGNSTNAQLRRYSHAAQFQAQTGRFSRTDQNFVNGVALGTFVGNAILANRATDGHPPGNIPTDQGQYWWAYQFNLPYFPGAAQSRGYIQVRPFALPGYGPAGGDVTYVVPPLSNNSASPDFAQFKTEWEELYSYGTSNPALSARTPEKDATARFHDGNFGSQIGNTIDILTSANIRQRSTDLLRIIAITAMCSHDAHANHWYWKYTYLNGRPISKYRQVPADEVNGLGAQRDTAWTPVLTTSQNPEHPSGHASRTGGLTASYRRAFGDNLTFRTISFSDPAAPARTYNSFTDFQNEVMSSRTFGGVHWRASGPAGRDMAERVTAYIWDRFLKPLGRGNHD